MARWRGMQVADLEAAEALGSVFHIHHPEGPDIAPERQRLAPEFCFVLDDDGDFRGYCVAHPWGGAMPPGLNVRIGRLPDAADTLHIHDVVLTQAVRGQRQTPVLLGILAERAREQGLVRMTLIAVGDAGGYWRRQGFADDFDEGRVAFVRESYGSDATPMTRRVASEPTAAA